MKAEPIIAEQGQEMKSQHSSQLQTNPLQLQAERLLTYKITKWDNKPQNSKLLTQLRHVLSQQLPELPTQYIQKIISDSHHISLMMLRGNQVIGGTSFRVFKKESLAEVIFFAIDQNHQTQGFGKRLMEILKNFLQSQKTKHILTFADDTAGPFFKRQGFTDKITLSKQVWKGLIKQYSRSKLMQCQISEKINYLLANEIIQKQKNYIDQEMKKICIQRVILKKSFSLAIKQKRSGFMDSYPSISLQKMIRRLPGFEEYKKQTKGTNLGETSSKVSMKEELQDLIDGILIRSQAASFHLDHWFYHETPSSGSQKCLNGVNFSTICTKIQKEEYGDLTQFVRDLNSFMVIIQDKYKEGDKKKSVEQLGKFIYQKIDNIRDLERVLSLSENSKDKIEEEKPPESFK